MIHYISPETLKKFRGKTAVLRIDLNAKPGREKNFLRMEAILPTLKLLLKNKIKVVVLSHRGRPNKPEPKLSLRPFVPVLSRKLGKKVRFLKTLKASGEGEVFLVENLRFWPAEEKNDSKFAGKLSELGDFYVNDAFAVSHRKNASVSAITRYLPSYGGLLFEKEIKSLDSVLKATARRPFVVVIGGAKVGDKLGFMTYLWKRADCFLLGSGPAATFFAAEGLPIGESLLDKGSIPVIKKFIGSKKLFLPIDVKMKDKQILDIGENTAEKYSEIISKAQTVVWNGPVGMFERKEFSGGTKAIWKAVLKNKKARIVVGGGETLASLGLITNNLKPLTKNKNLFLSTGGGAMLEYLSGEKLPGIESLK